MKIIYSLLLIAFVLMMVGCGLSGEEIASTVENQVAMQVQATIEALPSVTPVDTATPLATFTPPATYTPYPTLTPMPTFTPQSTYTPFPTSEPTPEDTATAVPSATAISVIQPTLPPPTPSITNLEIMKTELANMLRGLEDYMGMISIRKSQHSLQFSGYRPVNCHENIALRDRMISTVTLDVGTDVPEVQTAYAVYLDAVQGFADLTNAWNEDCLASIAEGDSERIIGDVHREDLRISVQVFKNSLNSVNNTLLALEE